MLKTSAPKRRRKSSESSSSTSESPKAKRKSRNGSYRDQFSPFCCRHFGVCQCFCAPDPAVYPGEAAKADWFKKHMVSYVMHRATCPVGSYCEACQDIFQMSAGDYFVQRNVALANGQVSMPAPSASATSRATASMQLRSPPPQPVSVTRAPSTPAPITVRTPSVSTGRAREAEIAELRRNRALLNAVASLIQVMPHNSPLRVELIGRWAVELGAQDEENAQVEFAPATVLSELLGVTPTTVRRSVERVQQLEADESMINATSRPGRESSRKIPTAIERAVQVVKDNSSQSRRTYKRGHKRAGERMDVFFFSLPLVYLYVMYQYMIMEEFLDTELDEFKRCSGELDEQFNLVPSRERVSYRTLCENVPKNYVYGHITECACGKCRDFFAITDALNRICLAAHARCGAGCSQQTNLLECANVLAIEKNTQHAQHEELAETLERKAELDAHRLLLGNREYDYEKSFKDMKIGEIQLLADFSSVLGTYTRQRTQSEGRGWVHVFGVMAYKKTGPNTFDHRLFTYFGSEGENQDVMFVRRAMLLLTNEEFVKSGRVVGYWTDTCAGQFWNRRTLFFMTVELPKIRLWTHRPTFHGHCPNHGKSAVDGAFATLKTYLRKLAISGAHLDGIQALVDAINSNFFFNLTEKFRHAAVLPVQARDDLFDVETFDSVREFLDWQYSGRCRYDDDVKDRTQFELRCREHSREAWSTQWVTPLYKVQADYDETALDASDQSKTAKQLKAQKKLSASAPSTQAPATRQQPTKQAKPEPESSTTTTTSSTDANTEGFCIVPEERSRPIRADEVVGIGARVAFRYEAPDCQDLVGWHSGTVRQVGKHAICKKFGRQKYADHFLIRFDGGAEADGGEWIDRGAALRWLVQ